MVNTDKKKCCKNIYPINDKLTKEEWALISGIIYADYVGTNTEKTLGIELCDNTDCPVKDAIK